MDWVRVKRTGLSLGLLVSAIVCMAGMGSADYVHQQDYVWYNTVGAKAVDVKEFVSSTADPDVFLFEYTVDAIPGGMPADAVDANPTAPGDQWITSFAVPKGASTWTGDEASTVGGVSGIHAWDFNNGVGGYYAWTGPLGLGIDGIATGSFSVWVRMPANIRPVWRYATGQVDYAQDLTTGLHGGLISGIVSCPNVPEPGTMSLLSVGLAGLGCLARRRRRTV